MECRVEFDYEAQESDELSLTKGDVIVNVVTKMDGWWEGTLTRTEKRGMFPDNFVKVVTSHSSSSGDENHSAGDTVQLRKKSSTNARRLKALFSYNPEQEDELHLEVGDVVDFIAEVEEGWWKGQLKGRTGIFPSNFVSELDLTALAASTTLNGNKNGVGVPELGKQTDKKSRVSVNVKVPPDVVPALKPTITEEDTAPKLPPKPIRETARCFYPYAAQNDDELELKEGDIVLIHSKECDDEGWWRGEVHGKIGVFPDNFVQIITPNNPFPATSNSSGPALTATERTSGGIAGNLLKNDLISATAKKELPNLVGNNTTTLTVVDGCGNSKIASDKDNDKYTVKESVTKKNSVMRNNKEKVPPVFNMHPAKPLTPSSPVSSTIVYNQKSHDILISKDVSLDSTLVDPISDFNDVGRGDKLIHLTASRAKPPPKRRPPSTSTTKENESSFLNGSESNSIEETTVDNSRAPNLPSTTTTPFNLSLKSVNANSAITTPTSTGNENVSQKDASPNPLPVSTPKAPWLAELKKKQDKKQSPSIMSSPSSVSPTPAPQQKEKEFASSTTPVSTTRAPPLPVKPVLSQVSPVSSFERTLAQSPTSPSPSPSLPALTHSSTSSNTNITSTTIITTNNNVSNVASKLGQFGGQKRSVTTINHIGTGNGNSGDTQHNSATVGGSHPEWVPYKEYAKLEVRVSSLETDNEMMKKQLNLLLEQRNFTNNKGHIV